MVPRCVAKVMRMGDGARQRGAGRRGDGVSERGEVEGGRYSSKMIFSGIDYARVLSAFVRPRSKLMFFSFQPHRYA